MAFTVTCAKGFEALLSETMSAGQDMAEKQAGYLKDITSATTLNEWTDIQNRMTQEGFDDLCRHTAKISEINTNIISEAAEPFNKQIAKGIKKVQTIAA